MTGTTKALVNAICLHRNPRELTSGLRPAYASQGGGQVPSGVRRGEYLES